MTDSPPILEAIDLQKSYGKGRGRNHVLHGVSLSVRAGEFVAVMGPSGCGKTTLLNLLGLMTLPDDGQICYDGRAVSPQGPERNRLRRRRIGFVFQRFNLLAQLSGRDNVRIALKVRGLLDDFGPGVDPLLDTCGVARVADRKPGQMSIGEQQRIAVVRALVHQPALLLADEPTGNLDSQNSTSLMDLFCDIHRRGQTILMITHSAEAAGYADRILTMKDGQFEPHA